MPTTLSVAVVTFAPDEQLLATTLGSLAEAFGYARQAGVLRKLEVVLVDNGPEGRYPIVKSVVSRHLTGRDGIEPRILTGHGNVGFGRANNLALTHCRGEVHLILNPDVELHRDALAEGLRFLDARTDVGAVTPNARHADGSRQHLVKEYPTPGVLFLRGFAPKSLRVLFKSTMDRYERRGTDWDREQDDVRITSGAFLFVRRALLDQVKAFDPGYFLYFEDFDLTLRLSRLTTIAYVPSVRIVHHGGHAAGKGAKHIAMFIRSGWRFLSTHGWFKP